MTRQVCDAYYVNFMIPYTRIIFQNFRIQTRINQKCIWTIDNAH